MERYLVEGGIQLIKIWLEVSDKEQKRRFEARMDDPLAPVETQPDGPALAQQVVRVFARPRHDAQGHGHQMGAVVYPALGRQKARAPELHPPHPESDSLQESPREKVKLPKRSMKGAYDDQASLKGRKFVPEKY